MTHHAYLACRTTMPAISPCAPRRVLNSMQATRGHQHAGRIIVTGILLLSLSGCGFFTKKPTEDKNPLLATECPAELQPVSDDSFGATVKAAIGWAQTYHNCRRAALTGAGK